MQENDSARPNAGGPRWAIIGLFVIAATAAIAQARDFLMPLSLAILLFFVFAPLLRWLQRRRVPSGIAAAGITTGLLGVFIGIALVISGPTAQMVDDAPAILSRLELKFGELKGAIGDLRDLAHKIDEAAKIDENPRDNAVFKATEHAAPPPPDQPDGGEDTLIPVSSSNVFFSLLAGTPVIVGQLAFVLFLLFFMLSSGDLLYLKIVQSFGTVGQKRRAYGALREIEESLGSYLGTITIINAGLGAAIGVAMWMWGMPAPAMFGVAAFLLNYIPYLGLITGTIIATAIALVTKDGFIDPLLIGATFAGLGAIEGQLITPYSLSRRLEMNTVVVFIAVALWAWLWSVVGMIVAVPMLVVMRVLCDHIPGLERLGNFIGGEAPTPLGPEGEEARGPDGRSENGNEAARRPAKGGRAAK